MNLKSALRFFLQIASAVHYAHQKGVLHRDIKPANVLLDDSDNALLNDFGLTRMVEGATRLTDMVQDHAGNIWLATAGSGVLRLTGGRPLSDAQWQFYTRQAAGLPSDRIKTIYVDNTDMVYAITDDGRAARFNDTVWKAFDVGTPITSIFEDSRGRLWVGTGDGVQFWDGRVWSLAIPEVSATCFYEGPVGTLWIGTQDGLLRYDLHNGRVDSFDARNSPLRDASVNEIFVDSGGRVWVTVSTSAVVRGPDKYTRATIVLSSSLFASLFIIVFRARRGYPVYSDCGEKIEDEISEPVIRVMIPDLTAAWMAGSVGELTANAIMFERRR